MTARKLHRDGNKHCPRCDTWKPLDRFSTARRLWDGKTTYCKECSKAFKGCRKKKNRRNRERYNGTPVEQRKNNRLLSRYGITLDQFKALERKQGGKCAICDRELRLLVDHCHSTGRVRGLLCYSCNHALGVFRECPNMMSRALDYANNADALAELAVERA